MACFPNSNRKSPRPSRHCFTKQQRHLPYQQVYSMKSKFDSSVYTSSTVLDPTLSCESSSSGCNLLGTSSPLEPLSVETSRKFSNTHSHLLQKDKTKRLFRDSGLGGISASYMVPGSLTENLTATHLRKAKLMFFYQRYPNSSTLRQFFTDVKFNRNNNAQLIKVSWLLRHLNFLPICVAFWGSKWDSWSVDHLREYENIA